MGESLPHVTNGDSAGNTLRQTAGTPSGIDRWVGGTHVTPDNAWRWDPAELALVRPAG
jgi:hypothetical protein